MAEPTPLSGRNQAMDVLRGVAVLGILLININAFALPIDQTYSLSREGGDGPIDTWVFGLVSVLAAGKFMSLFSLLFGAGVAMMAQRRRQRGEPAAGQHYKRLAGLAVMGLFHGLLIWFGDILFYYAVCGAVLYPVLRLSNRNLLWLCIGAWVLALVLSTGCGALSAWGASIAPEGEQTAGFFENEVELMRGGLLDVMRVRAVHWLLFLVVSPFAILPWLMALMLTGVLAYRGGWITAERPTRDYTLLLLGGLVVGLPIAGARTWVGLMQKDMLEYALYFPLNMIDALAIGAAWLALVMIVVRRQWLSRLRRTLAAVGRMALTNYLAQSLICTTLFYGYGLGLFASLSRAELLGVVLGVWLVQLVWSRLWLSRFQRGPMEAAWRRLTYGRAVWGDPPSSG